MKQAIYKTHGKADAVVELVELARPVLEAGQTRVKILCAPINPSDIAQAEGVYGFQPPLPAAAGMEGIGEVIEVNGEGPEVGTLVLLAEPPGSWSTEKVMNTAAVVPVPPADIDQLSMLSVNPATAYLLLTKYVALNEGDWLIQSAGNSAVAGLVASLAKARGVKVAALVRRDSAVADAQDAGADAVFVDGPDLAERVDAELEVAPRLALDAVGGSSLGRLASTLQAGGTAVMYGNMSGEDAQLPDSAVIFNDVIVRGFWLVHWFNTATAEEQAQVYGELTAMILQGTLKASVDRIFPLEEINAALAYTMKGGRSGKVLIAPNGL
ncbi:zinc-dependent alcohol dehydrogenase family protein [uncultured Ruegeria sp.]|uniref:zinc-dependent alcohol dehydrogenase family protein n=1 Tax=uncultured Ruegeria sp. TaxID=259304 RepID=UPI00261BC973|nr:zinc-dependent alcohol dehydrogenase family protein [uncultured Ruegeria sp.]